MGSVRQSVRHLRSSPCCVFLFQLGNVAFNELVDGQIPDAYRKALTKKDHRPDTDDCIVTCLCIVSSILITCDHLMC